MAPPSSSPPPLPNSPREDTPIAKLLNSLPIQGLKLDGRQKRLALFGCGGAAAFMMLMCGGLFVVGFVAAQQETERVRKELPVAHALWQSGQKQEAIAKYRTLLENGVAFMEKPERELIFERTITFDAERGNVESARQLFDRAKTYRVVITSDSRITQGLIARWEQEEKRLAEEKRIADEQTKQQVVREKQTSPPSASSSQKSSLADRRDAAKQSRRGFFGKAGYTTLAELKSLATGLEHDEVIEIMGKPDVVHDSGTIDTDGLINTFKTLDDEVWVYHDHLRNPITDKDKTVKVHFKKGTCISVRWE